MANENIRTLSLWLLICTVHIARVLNVAAGKHREKDCHIPTLLTWSIKMFIIKFRPKSGHRYTHTFFSTAQPCCISVFELSSSNVFKCVKINSSTISSCAIFIIKQSKCLNYEHLDSERYCLIFQKVYSPELIPPIFRREI